MVCVRDTATAANETFRQTVPERVQERGQGDGFEELLIRLLVLHETRGPEERHDQQTHREVHGADEPRKREVVVDLLVDDVESGC